ncbi:MAG: cation diffusion facilitator family transporter [Aulosira sp. ZfuCHP01]|nr:cation diffusion facilitator family transporter [Aulosira sp. ZfuVER01]MDZ8000903.1 cation diffusion facilitator family transporter [Aulosira sp. DedVER01a]MDZ8052411.1 cation diffusion facilitator family transporter [Aulosira sp. ZfuCHP01]
MYTSTLANETREQPIKLLWIVLGMRGGLFLAELIVGLWIHSLSLLAVAGHMMVDVLAIAVALMVAELNRRSSNKLDLNPNHLEAWSAAFNSLLLLGIAVFVAWSAFKQIQTPQLSAGLPMLIMAVLGFVVKGVNAALLYEESHHSLNIRGVFLHAIADAINSISLLVASLAVIMLNWFWADAIASIFVSLLIFINALSLLRESLKTLKTKFN